MRVVCYSIVSAAYSMNGELTAPKSTVLKWYMMSSLLGSVASLSQKKQM